MPQRFTFDLGDTIMKTRPAHFVAVLAAALDLPMGAGGGRSRSRRRDSSRRRRRRRSSRTPGPIRRLHASRWRRRGQQRRSHDQCRSGQCHGSVAGKRREHFQNRFQRRQQQLRGYFPPNTAAARQQAGMQAPTANSNAGTAGAGNNPMLLSNQPIVQQAGAAGQSTAAQSPNPIANQAATRIIGTPGGAPAVPQATNFATGASVPNATVPSGTNGSAPNINANGQIAAAYVTTPLGNVIPSNSPFLQANEAFTNANSIPGSPMINTDPVQGGNPNLGDNTNPALSSTSTASNG